MLSYMPTTSTDYKGRLKLDSARANSPIGLLLLLLLGPLTTGRFSCLSIASDCKTRRMKQVSYKLLAQFVTESYQIGVWILMFLLFCQYYCFYQQYIIYRGITSVRNRNSAVEITRADASAVPRVTWCGFDGPQTMSTSRGTMKLSGRRLTPPGGRSVFLRHSGHVTVGLVYSRYLQTIQSR